MGLIGGLIGDPLRYLIVCVSSSLPLLSVNQHNPDIIGTLVRCYSREQHDRGFCDFARLTTASLKNPAVGCGDTSRPAKVEPPMGKSGSTCRLFFIFNIYIINIYNYIYIDIRYVMYVYI